MHSHKESSKSFNACKPMNKDQLHAWKPSYIESRSPSVQNDFAWDYSKTSQFLKVKALAQTARDAGLSPAQCSSLFLARNCSKKKLII